MTDSEVALMPCRCTQRDDPTVSPSPRRIRAWLFFCITFVIIAPLASVLLGIYLHDKDFQDENLPESFAGRNIHLEAVLIAADAKAGNMIIDWNFIGESNSLCSLSNLSSCSDVNIYFDNNLLENGNQNVAIPGNNYPTQPIFLFNSTAFATGDILANSPTFRTTLSLFSPNSTGASLLHYPFDTYAAEILLFARDASTNATVGVVMASTRGIVIGFVSTAKMRRDVVIPSGAVDFMVTLQRSPLVKIFAILSVVSVWLITMILLLVMITSIFFNFKQRGEVLVVPVATLFTFTQLRASMPGVADGFGDILDFIGFLPCLTLLSLSAAITLGAFILTDPTEKSQKLTWDQILQALRKDDEQKPIL